MKPALIGILTALLTVAVLGGGLALDTGEPRMIGVGVICAGFTGWIAVMFTAAWPPREPRR